MEMISILHEMIWVQIVNSRSLLKHIIFAFILVLLTTVNGHSDSISSSLFTKKTGSAVYSEDCSDSLNSRDADWITKSSEIELSLNVDRYLRNMIKSLPSKGSISSNVNRYRKVGVRFKGENCIYSGKYRLTGDSIDHVGLAGEIPHSIKIQLKEGSIDNIVNFKLTTLRSRGGRYEILNVLLHKRLGLLAPRTAIVKVKLGGQVFDAIFQEDISKELLEYNDFHEAILIEGDEGYSPFTNPRIVNIDFVANTTFSRIGVYALRLMGNVWQMTNKSKQSLEGGDPALLIDYMPKNSRKNFAYVNLLNIAFSSYFGLSRDDTRIVYDHISNKFYPIYYDGHAGLSSPKYSDITFSVPADTLVKLINDLSLLNVDDLIVELDLHGAAFTKTELKKIIDGSIKFLKDINLEEKRSSFSLSEEEYIDRAKNILFRKNPDLAVFSASWIDNDQMVSECLVTRKTLSCAEPKMLTSGNFKVDFNRQRADRLFLHGLKNIPVGPRDNYLLDFESQRIPGTGTTIEYTRNLSVFIDQENRVVTFSEVADGLNVANQIKIFGGNLEDWSITMRADHVLGYDQQENIRASKHGLTGCITLHDITFQNLRINTQATKCEDAIHFVRSKGIISEIYVSDAKYDAIDADFSELIFNNVIVNRAGNDCIDFSAGSYVIDLATLTNCADKAISAGENSNVEILNIDVENSLIGVVSKDSSFLNVATAKFSDVEICMAAYRKKQEFRGGEIKAINSTCDTADYFVQPGSNIIVNNDRLVVK